MTVVIQPNDPGDTSDRQASQQSNTSTHAKIDEQRSRKQDSSSRESGSGKVVSCKQTCGVLRIRQRNVDEQALQHQEDANRVDRNTDRGCNPRNAIRLVPRPREDEEPDGCKGRGVDGRNESLFWGWEPVLDDLWVRDPIQVGPVGWDGDEDGHQDAQEHQSQLSQIKAVAGFAVDDGEDFEEAVVDPINQSDIHAREEYGRISNVDLERAPEITDDDFTNSEFRLVNLRLRLEVLVAGHLPQACCATQKNVRGGRFWQEEHEGDEDRAGKP